MTMLGGKTYDPTSAVTQSAASLLAMTALDTTNLRITFTAPASGVVFVRIRGTVHGATTFPSLLFGVLDGATVKAKIAPVGVLKTTALATAQMTQEATFVVSGLTGGDVFTWDAAYSVDVVLASTGLKYGGPDNATTNDAFGAISFEIYSADGFVAAVNYDPNTAVSKSSANSVMAAFDTTNARIAFTVPPSGKVFARVRCNAIDSAGTSTGFLLGILESTTVKARAYGLGGNVSTVSATFRNCQEAEFVISGLTPGASLTWDAAWASETTANGALKYGGPNDATTNTAWGCLQFELWDADYGPIPLGLTQPGRSPNSPVIPVY